MSSDSIIVKRIIKNGELRKELKSSDCVFSLAITTEITAIALAGVGNPLKVVVWVESRLKIASLRAANTGMTAGIIIMAKIFIPSVLTAIGAEYKRESFSI
jgi:hypothetical protein